MAITVKSGKGDLVLRKSDNLVGLKTKATTRSSEELDYVEKQYIPHLGGFNVVKLDAGAKTLDEKLDEVRERDDVQVGTHVYYAQGSNRPIVPTGDIIIIFQDGTSQDEQNIVLDEYKLELINRRDDYRIMARVTAQSPNPIKVAHLLQKVSLVKWAEPDLDTLLDEYAFVPPEDNLLEHQWHLKNDGFVADVNWRMKKGADAKVVDAWNRLGNMGSNDITIAVIDNGFDVTHPDLKDKIHRPFDLWGQSQNLPQGDPRFTHGTPCASIATAASNGQGLVGTAPNTRLMPVNGTSFSLRATEQMFDYCIKNGADVISCSWGTTDSNFDLSPMKKEAIANAARKGRDGKGCVIVFAVGNDDLDFVNFYAAHPDVIAVAASTSQDQHAPYSNRGREVTLCAPSNGDWPITAARAWWDEGLTYETGEYRYWRDGRSRGKHYKHFGGTSSAAPLVAGICALILTANPDLTAKEVREILTQTADKIGSPSEYTNGHSTKYGHGRVNADKAVAEALRRRDASEPPTEVEDSISTGKGLFRFSVERQPSEGWGVQIGAFAEYGNVLIQAEKLQSQFNAPIVVNISELEGRTVYKIVVGAYNNVDQARQLQDRMENAGVRGFIRSLADLK